jgi:hypothetical protein
MRLHNLIGLGFAAAVLAACGPGGMTGTGTPQPQAAVPQATGAVPGEEVTEFEQQRSDAMQAQDL